MIAGVAERVLALGDGRQLIGVDGRTAAGKTTFGHELADALAKAGRPVLRASLDDFKRPWRDRHLYDRESGEGYYRNAYDYARIAELLLDPFLATGECVLCAIDPRTQIDHSAQLVQAEDNAVLIVDGVFAFRPQLNSCWRLRIWLEVGAEASIGRGHARDGGDGAILRDRYQISEEIYLAEVDPVARADLVIDNSNFDAPCVLKS